MRVELKHFFNRKITWIFIFASVIFISAYMIIHMRTFEFRDSNREYLGKYTSKEELKDIYEEYKVLYEKTKEEYAQRGENVLQMDRTMWVYEYLLENYMAEDTFVIYHDTSTYGEKNSLSAYCGSSFRGWYVILVALMLFAILFFCTDFTFKRHVFLYAGENRNSILKRKIKAYLLVTFGFIALIEAICVIYGFLAENTVQNVLMSIEDKIYKLDVGTVIAWNVASEFVYYINYALLFMAIAILFRREIVTGVICIVVWKLIDWLFCDMFVDYFATFVNYMGNCFGRFSNWTIASVIKAAALVLINFIAIKQFNRKNI